MTTIPMKPATDDAIAPFATDDVISPDMPVIDMGIKEELPDNVVRRRRQHVVLILDNSSSMSGSKIAELNVAVQALIRELAVPENRKGFNVSIAFFNSSVSRLALGECATKLNVDPAVAKGRTNFEKALNEAEQIITEFKALPNPESWSDRQPVVLFMSDGQSSASPATIDKVKELAEVICVAFGDDCDNSMLAKIASDGQAHHVGTKGGQLRAFLASVGKTLTEKHQKNK